MVSALIPPPPPPTLVALVGRPRPPDNLGVLGWKPTSNNSSYLNIFPNTLQDWRAGSLLDLWHGCSSVYTSLIDIENEEGRVEERENHTPVWTSSVVLNSWGSMLWRLSPGNTQNGWQYSRCDFSCFSVFITCMSETYTRLCDCAWLFFHCVVCFLCACTYQYSVCVCVCMIQQLSFLSTNPPLIGESFLKSQLLHAGAPIIGLTQCCLLWTQNLRFFLKLLTCRSSSTWSPMPFCHRY